LVTFLSDQKAKKDDTALTKQDKGTRLVHELGREVDAFGRV